MAPRTRLPTSPSTGEFPSEADKYVRSGAMSEYGFNSVIRAIHNVSASKVAQIKAVVDTHKTRLGLRTGRAKPVTKTPDGSDNLDVQSLSVWASKIQFGDKEAVNQLKTLSATVAARLGG